MATQPAHGLRVESAETPARPEDYVVINDVRMVKPYHFDFCCAVKQRWFGRGIVDIFAREFPALSREYYEQALADGRLRVEGCQVAGDTPLKDGQRMRHLIHRHEPPVPAGPIQVVGVTPEAVAVCKPHGMPVHVAGQYRKNTVHGILQAERPDLGPLFPIHRLDKPVSGLLLFARSPAAAAALGATIEGHRADKVYVARVLGAFPASEQPIVVDVPLDWDPATNMASAQPGAAASVAAQAAARDGGAGAAAPAAPAEAAAPGAAADAAPAEAEQQAAAGEQQEAAGEQQQGLTRQERRLLKKQAKQAKRAAKAERVAAFAAATAAAAAAPSRAAAKPALTEFRLLAVAPDGKTSLVECRPRTGRTHQIRVHLQHLGHPIANDSQYGGTYGGPLACREMARKMGVLWRSPEGGGSADSTAAAAGGSGAPGEPAAAAHDGSKRPRLGEAGLGGQQGADAGEQQQAGAAALGAGGGAAAEAGAAAGAAAGVADGSGDAKDGYVYSQNRAFRSQPEYRLPPELCDALCGQCPFYAPKDYPLDLRPLWLHARSYSCAEDGWSFAAEPPAWARADWTPPLPEEEEEA